METKWKPKVAKSCKKVAIQFIHVKIVTKNIAIKAAYGNTQ